jgi:hypothetical protein
LKDTFEMTDLGLLHFFLGIQVWQLDDSIFISQPKYHLICGKYENEGNCKPCQTPFQSGVKLTKEFDSPKVDATLYRQLVGSLIYSTHSRLDISFVFSLVSRFMQDPRESHLKAIKMIVHYVKGTSQLGMKYLVMNFSSWSDRPTQTGMVI